MAGASGSSRTRLRSAIKDFGSGLRGLADNVTTGIEELQRAADRPPCAGVREFRSVMQHMEGEVTELSAEVEHLQRFSSGAISIEELLGHCSALYASNRAMAARLLEHARSTGAAAEGLELRHGEDPTAARAGLNEAGASHDHTSDFQERLAPYTVAKGARSPLGLVLRPLARPKQTPGDDRLMLARGASGVPDGWGSWGGAARSSDENVDPGAPNTAAAATAAAACALVLGGTAAKKDSYAAGWTRGAARGGGGAARPAGAELGTAPPAPRDRASVDSCATATPELFMLSPSVLALQNKYGSGGSGGSGGGGSSLGLGSIPSFPTSGAPPSASRRPAATGTPRDAMDVGTPQAQPADDDGAAAAARGGGAGAYGGGGGGGGAQQQQEQSAGGRGGQAHDDDDDDTCNLYQQLIRSKGVACSMGAAVGAKPQPRARFQVMAEPRPAVAPASAAKAAAVQQLSSTLESLESLWVSSGQAARTPRKTPRKGGTGATPGRPPRATMMDDDNDGGALTPRAGGGDDCDMRDASAHASPTLASRAQMSSAAAAPEPEPRAGTPRRTPRKGACDDEAGAEGDAPPSQRVTRSRSQQASQPSTSKPHHTPPVGAGGGAHTTSAAPQGSAMSPGTSALLSMVYGGSDGSTALRSAATTVDPATGTSQRVSRAPLATVAADDAQHGDLAEVLAGPLIQAAAYVALPSFCRSQLPLAQLNEGLLALMGAVLPRRVAGEAEFRLEDLEAQGLPPTKGKVFVNCLIKLGHAELRSTAGGLTYVLKGI
ncbi:hypothetical protein FOA52_010958 [Chlamydomonas sp. UWO 241]|nr:hypothetical protein FOA52_010958 [Chlamydomonas sp. UWO 241]